MTSQIKVELQEVMGSDKAIANAAWTSSFDYEKKKARNEEDIKRVVNLLADEKHSVPFESVVFRFWMRLPIAIDRQLMTHRIACLGEDNDLYFDLPKKNKGSNYKLSKIKVGKFANNWLRGVKHDYKNGKDTYKNHTKRLKKMKIRSVNELTGEIIHSSISNVFDKGIQPLYKITLANGKTIDCTLTHQLFSDKGWTRLCDELNLAENYFGEVSIIPRLSLATNGEPIYKNYDYVKSLKDRNLSVQEMADDMGISYHTVRKYLKVHGLQFDIKDFYFKKGLLPWNKGKSYKFRNPVNITESERKRKSRSRLSLQKIGICCARYWGILDY